MMRDARMYLTTAPWVLFGPGFMIIWCVSGFYVLGAGLRKHFQIRDRFNW
jgi:ABC-type dipeptide/oligopeptide/nickel transport system permease subunit